MTQSRYGFFARVAVDRAKSIIILNDAPVDSDRETKELADAKVLKTILAVMSSVDDKNLPSIVAEIHLANKQKLAKNLSDRISIIDEHAILAKLMVQTSRTSGLAKVYDSLVGFAGSEVYIKPVSLFTSLSCEKVTFGDLCAAAIRRGESCFGVCISADSDNRDKNYGFIINPHKSMEITISSKDYLITLAEDET